MFVAFTAFLVLAQPVLPAPSPPPPAAPASIEEGCDPTKLNAMLSAPKAKVQELTMDLDRRIQRTLAEERRQDGERDARQKEVEQAKGMRARITWGLYALALLSLFVGIRAARRRSVGAAGGAWALMVVTGLLGWRLGATEHRLEGARLDAASRSLELASCRLRLVETRAELQHSLLAHCYHDLSEVDEDLVGYMARANGGGSVTPAELTRMHDDITKALR